MEKSLLKSTEFKQAVIATVNEVMTDRDSKAYEQYLANEEWVSRIDRENLLKRGLHSTS